MHEWIFSDKARMQDEDTIADQFMSTRHVPLSALFLPPG